MLLGVKLCLVIFMVVVVKEFYIIVDVSFVLWLKRFLWIVWNNNDENYRNIGFVEYGFYYCKLCRFLNIEFFFLRCYVFYEVIRV